ncbi:STAS domain-containing protein [Saccharothrix sp. HUAS TT1]|uniref:STAS domain-containing protein n=1 Tax=unclassified Saccharothrix TaxID=2593673 RepID=UPI00345B736A
MGHQGPGATAAVASAVVEGVPVLHVTGEIDMDTTRAVRRDLLEWLEGAGPAAVLDLTGVTFMASSGLALLAEIDQHTERSGTAFVIVATQHSVLRPLRMTGMDEVFDLHSDVRDAALAVRGASEDTADLQR